LIFTNVWREPPVSSLQADEIGTKKTVENIGKNRVKKAIKYLFGIKKRERKKNQYLKNRFNMGFKGK
jgi:hypothetical protein